MATFRIFSEGALRLTGQRILYTGLFEYGRCAGGARIAEYAQIFLTYRATALSAEAADQLIELIIAELECDIGR